VINYVYEIPFGLRRKHLSKGLAGEILGDWGLDGIWSASSGMHFTPGLSGGVSNSAGGGGDRPNRARLTRLYAMMLGAQSVRPDMKVKIIWVNTWFDPPREADAAKAEPDAYRALLARQMLLARAETSAAAIKPEMGVSVITLNPAEALAAEKATGIRFVLAPVVSKDNPLRHDPARLTAALLDRLTHHAQILLFQGESYRFRESRQRGKEEAPLPTTSRP